MDTTVSVIELVATTGAAVSFVYEVPQQSIYVTEDGSSYYTTEDSKVIAYYGTE